MSESLKKLPEDTRKKILEKRKKIYVFITSILFLLASSYYFLNDYISNFGGLSNYSRLLEQCYKSQYPQCCVDSLERIKKGNFQIPDGPDCPPGTKLNTLRCPSSYKWCE